MLSNIGGKLLTYFKNIFDLDVLLQFHQSAQFGLKLIYDKNSKLINKWSSIWTFPAAYNVYKGVSVKFGTKLKNSPILVDII